MTTATPSLAMPDLPGDLGGGQAVITGDHDDPDPGGVAPRDGAATSGRGGSNSADETEEA